MLLALISLLTLVFAVRLPITASLNCSVFCLSANRRDVDYGAFVLMTVKLSHAQQRGSQGSIDSLWTYESCMLAKMKSEKWHLCWMITGAFASTLLA